MTVPLLETCRSKICAVAIHVHNFFGKHVDKFLTGAMCLVAVAFVITLVWVIAVSATAMSDLIDTVKTIPQIIHIEMMETRQMQQNETVEAMHVLESETQNRKAADAAYQTAMTAMQKEHAATAVEIQRLKAELELEKAKRHRILGIF